MSYNLYYMYKIAMLHAWVRVFHTGSLKICLMGSIFEVLKVETWLTHVSISRRYLLLLRAIFSLIKKRNT